MHNLRLLFLLVVVGALGATCAAQSQDGAGGLDDQVQNKFGDKDQDQAKAKADKKREKAKAKNNDGRRKHWYSMPHFRHKKHDTDSAARQPQANSNSKTASAKPVKNASSPKQTAGNATTSRTGHKTATMARTDNNHARPARKTVAGKAHANNAVAGNKAPAKARGKTVASTNHAGKAVRHNCTPAESKKGGCQAVQKHTKAATRTS